MFWSSSKRRENFSYYVGFSIGGGGELYMKYSDGRGASENFSEKILDKK